MLDTNDIYGGVYGENVPGQKCDVCGETFFWAVDVIAFEERARLEAERREHAAVHAAVKP